MTANGKYTSVHLVIDFIVKILEVVMMWKRFSQLSGLQLKRDAGALVSHCKIMTRRTVSETFACLSKMTTIQNLDGLYKILDFWGEDSRTMP